MTTVRARRKEAKGGREGEGDEVGDEDGDEDSEENGL
eukprot:CAMPEP_0174888622 /NCGR_PEP_ID=MMETSP0167-20121228/3905_1 /TAXON_ID=38298 /ORGANISM="Rhodella maculata, Strain CCMP736" /LENGTH=36 /DNA_ID= /DNA_START= /DNA_END= /DNA_ORIENTATION=